MTLLSPYLILGRYRTYASTIHNNDISTSSHLAALNAAIAECAGTFIFDRGYNITAARANLPTNLFVLPANGPDVEGRHDRPIDMSMMVNSGVPKNMFRKEGTASLPQPLTVDLFPGMSTVTVGSAAMAALALAPGSRVSISSDRLFVSGGTPNAEEQGEISTVVAVTESTFTISPPAQDDYLTSDAARIQKLSMARGGCMNGVRGIGPGQFSTDVVGDRMLHLIWCDGLQLNSVCQNYLDNGSYLYSCPDARVNGWKSLQELTGGRTANSYGLAVVNACHDAVVDDWTCIGGKHAIVQTESLTARGGTRRLTISNGFGSAQSNYCVATHTNLDDLWILHNRMNGVNGGVDAGAANILSKGNEVTFLPDANIGIGYSISEVPARFRSIDDKSVGGRFGLRCNTTAVPPLSGVPNEISVDGFRADGFSNVGLQFLTLLSGAADLTLRDIHTRRAGGAATGVTSAPSITVEGDFSNVVIGDCNLQAAAGNASACIVTSGISNARVRNVDYAGHAAPILGGTDVTSSNVGVF